MTRTVGVFRKTLREVGRDPLTVALSVAFAPVFVLLYYLVFPTTAATYTVAVVNQDAGAVWRDGRPLSAGRDLEAALATSQDGSGRALLRVTVVGSRQEALARIDRRESTAMMLIPPGFSRSVAALSGDPTGARPVSYTLAGDLNQPGYLVTAVLADAAVQEYVHRATGRAGPVDPVEEPIGGPGVRTDFEIYVPGLIVFSVVMLVFLAAMTVAREIESGAMRRLRLTRMTATEYLTGTSAVLALVSVASVAITFITAWLCGFRSQGPLWVGAALLAITTLSVIGVGMMVAAVSGTVARAFVIANFPLGLLMFFTGVIMPMPRVTWWTVAGHPIGPFEALAPTHAVTALQKVVSNGGGLQDVLFELIALLVLTAAYFAAGVALLHRAQRRAA